MSGLVLRLAAPLQSWGVLSTFEERDTLAFPTRSGLIGMFAAAAGLRRGAPLDRYAALRFTIRIDRPGLRIVDFHTIGGGMARGVPTADGGRRPYAVVTRRHYLSDAVFVVAVEGEPELIEEIGRALAAPRWQVFLGRRSCPPNQPFILRHTAADPVDELLHKVPVAPSFERRRSDQRLKPLDIVRAADNDGGERTVLADDPVSFAPLSREYAQRSIAVTHHEPPEGIRTRHTNEYHQALAAYVRER